MVKRDSLPPLGGHAPPLQCNRAFNAALTDHCGKPATWHIIWTSDAENGLVCDEHANEARRRWAFVGIHPYEMSCSMPGARYLADENRCVVDEGLLGIEAVALVEGRA
jgi:hypothetical protein